MAYQIEMLSYFLAVVLRFFLEKIFNLLLKICDLKMIEPAFCLYINLPKNFVTSFVVLFSFKL